MKKQEILALVAAGENSRVEFKLDDFVRVTVGKASVKKPKSVGKASDKIISAIWNNA